MVYILSWNQNRNRNQNCNLSKVGIGTIINSYGSAILKKDQKEMLVIFAFKSITHYRFCSVFLSEQGWEQDLTKYFLSSTINW
jgi:hypothetical protein